MVQTRVKYMMRLRTDGVSVVPRRESNLSDARYADPEHGANVVDDCTTLVHEEDDDDVEQANLAQWTKVLEEASTVAW